MNSVISFLKLNIIIEDQPFRLLFKGLFLTTLLAYVSAVFPFLPSTFFGFNWPGIAWILMLFISLFSVLKIKKSEFPILIWLPWAIYLFGYIILDFSFIGLQLTMQYFLPVLVGIISASFTYTWSKLIWLFQGLFKTVGIVYLLFISYSTLFGYTPHMAATPMLFYVMATVSLGVFFLFGKKKFLILYLLLFLMPVVSVTRMAILVFGASFVLHFANKGVGKKILASFAGGVLMLLVLNSKSFQEKTFYSGSGDITAISLNYYENDELNSNGRKTWQSALESGLKEKPIWGNGPRSDATVLGEAIGKEIGEAHNDYLSVRYNYGWVGLSFLLAGLAFTFLRLLKMSFNYKEPVFQLLCLSTMTLFIGLLFFMYSDNILKYTIWFPNYFFALIGICFSMYKKGFTYE